MASLRALVAVFTIPMLTDLLVTSAAKGSCTENSQSGVCPVAGSVGDVLHTGQNDGKMPVRSRQFLQTHMDSGLTQMVKASKKETSQANQTWMVTINGATGKILKFWANTEATLLGQAERFLREEQLITDNTTCSICSGTLHACCTELFQNGAIVDALAMLEPDVPLTMRVKLLSERGLDPELTKLIRSLGLSANDYAKLGPYLLNQGVYKASLLTAVDPLRLVADLGLSDNGGTLVQFLGNKFAEKIAEQRDREPVSQGQHWQPEELIRRNGLFRGLRISKPGQDEKNLQEAVQFTPKAKLMGETLERSMLLTPDLKTSEFLLESKSATDMNMASLMMESFGQTSLETMSSSWALNFGLDLGSVGIPVAVNVSAGESESAKDEQWRSEQNSIKEKLNELSNAYTKSIYFVEPRQTIIVDPQWLQPTPALKQAFHDVNESLHNRSSSYSVDHLFGDFGTHTCTRAVLGGWWKITAKISSTNMYKVLEMKQATSHAIDTLMEKASYTKVKVGIFGNDLNFTHNDDEFNTHHENSSTQLGRSEVLTKNDSHIDLSQEWKGGISGWQGDKWRSSLDEKVNSNWKIIDRFLGSCRGIWRWVEDDEQLKFKICEGWRKGFLRSVEGLLNESEHSDQEEWASCTGAAHMRPLRQKVNDLRKKAAEEERRRAQQKCKATVGYHWNDGSCVVNRCKCGNQAGEVGVGCLRHGAQKCKDEQRAKCSTMACPMKFWPNASAKSALCASSVCKENPDKALCCQQVSLTDTFTIELKSNKGHWCDPCHNSRIYWRVDGTDSAGLYRFTAWQNVGKGPKPGAGARTYSIGYQLQMRPTKICINWRRAGVHCNWCPGYLKVFNGRLGKSHKSFIGNVILPRFSTDRVACSSVAYTR